MSLLPIQPTKSIPIDVYKRQLAYCGKVSGRDTDKVKDCGLTVIDFDGAAGFQEADLVLVCNKKYVGELKEEMCIRDSLSTI